MQTIDLLFAPFYIILYLVIFTMYRSQNLINSPLKKFFISGLVLKIIGAIAAGLIYKFYYITGDTFTYYWCAESVNNLWDVNFETWWECISSKSKDNILGNYVDFKVAKFDKTFFFVKICALIGLFTFDNYTVMAITMGVFCFYCSWKIYKVVCHIYPHMYDTFGYCIFYIPSVVFWGSGLFKDTITYGFLLLFTASFYNIFFRKYQVFKHLILIILASWCIFSIREFILYLILGPSIMWYFLSFKDKIKNSTVRFVAGPVFISIGLVVGVIGMAILTNADEQLQTANLIDKSKGFQQWHSADGAGGSSYTLGDMDYSTFGVIKKMPLAINVSLFRPYLWEVTNPVMLIAALESLFFLYLFLGVFRAVKFKFLYHFTDNHHAFFFLSFGMIYAFVAGFNSYNFGALVRYKIPCMPYFVIGIYMMKEDILNKAFERKKEQEIRVAEEQLRKQKIKEQIRASES